MATDNSHITRLINDLRQLFTSKSAPESAHSEITQGYQSPIRGTWYNSGGFDPGGGLRPNGRKGHSGLDMRAQGGTPLYPIAPGVVTSVGIDPLGGNVVNVQHDNGVRTYYAHLATVKVHKGDKVGYNTILGTVGDSGNAKGTVYHCHFQVWKDNQLQNPASFFSVPPYTNVSPKEKAKGDWVSNEAKQEAKQFNMKLHLQNQKVAFSNEIDYIVKCADIFYELSLG